MKKIAMCLCLCLAAILSVGCQMNGEDVGSDGGSDAGSVTNDDINGETTMINDNSASQPAVFNDYIVITDYLKSDTGSDVSDDIQKVIRDNPNCTIYFPDGEYIISKPITTPANPKKSVCLKLSNYATIKASDTWRSTEAMIRLGATDAANDISTNGSNYSFSGGIVDGNKKADGISIDGGRETAVFNVSIKNTVVGIHIKYGANSGSSDADISNVNIVGTNTAESIGVFIESYDNSLQYMRIASVQVGIKLSTGGNFLRNIHPLYIFGSTAPYAASCGFWDVNGDNWYDMCYSDQFATGFRVSGNNCSVYNSCFCFWYTAEGGTETGFKADGKFNSIIKNSKVVFKEASKIKSYLTVGQDNGNGVIEFPIFNESLSGDKSYQKYLYGKVVPLS